MTNETIAKQHTPGPWIVTEQSPIDGLSGIDSLKSIARPVKNGINTVYITVAELVSADDAELIARAPSLLSENESLRQQNAELVRALAFVRDDLNSELDYETRLIIESALASVQS